MRTTLTLDEDVAKAIERRRRERGTAMRDEVNELLRTGLLEAAKAERGGPMPDYQLPTFDPGRMLISDPRVLKELLDYEDEEPATR